MKAAIVAAAIGGGLAVVEGLLLIVLGSLAGLAENREGEATVTDGYVVLALGAIVLMEDKRPSPCNENGAASAATAAVGFLAENALWILLPPSLSLPRRLRSSQSEANCDSQIATPSPRSRPNAASSVDQIGQNGLGANPAACRRAANPWCEDARTIDAFHA